MFSFFFSVAGKSFEQFSLSKKFSHVPSKFVLKKLFV